MINVLVVDDEAIFATLLANLLPDDTYQVIAAHSCVEARAKARAFALIEVAIVDKNLPDGQGTDLIGEFKAYHPDIEVLLVTAYPTWETVVESLQFGAFDYIAKPVEDLQSLEVKVRNAAAKARLGAEQRLLVTQLRESNERYECTVRGSNDGLWDWNLVRNEIYCSERWWKMLGLPCPTGTVDPGVWLGRVHAEDREPLRAALQAHLDSATDHFEHEYRALHEDGSYRWMSCRGLAVRDEAGCATRIAGSQTDVTFKKMAETQLLQDAFSDGLTGLANRALLLDRLRLTVARRQRHASYRYALAYLDLDRFKNVIDDLGYAGGDELIQALAKRLLGCVRTCDTVARVGGDGFAILFDGVEASGDFVELSARVQKLFAVPFTIHGRDVFVTASIGFVIGDERHQRAGDPLLEAEMAMYRAKANGRARCELFEPTMRAGTVGRLKLETDLRRAVERREFVVHYQPIVQLTTGEVAGFEALVRWQHPERGLLYPGDFLHAVDELGLSTALTDEVVRAVSDQIQIWRKQFPDAHPYVSVNLSGQDVRLKDLPVSIAKLLEGEDARSTRLKFEVTETALMVDKERGQEQLERLKKLGFELLMDDFGVGTSSLAHLSALPIDVLKIDRSFVRDCTTSKKALQMVRTIIQLAHLLNMGVVAEGIETKEQLACLLELDCDYGQGYLFSKATNAGIATEVVARGRVA